MTPNDFVEYMEKPCRLKFKSGKEVFGVIWKEEDNSLPNYYFASSDEYKAYKKALKNNDLDTCNKLKVSINIDDVIGAEILRGIIPGKDMFS